MLKKDWAKRLIPLSQNDVRWKNVSIGGGRTIGAWGCLLTVYTMCHNAAHGTSLTPLEFLAEMRAQGGITSSGNMFNGSLSKSYPLHWSNKGWLSADNPAFAGTLQSRLQAGVPTPARVDFNPATGIAEQHWLLVVGWRGDAPVAIDPIDGMEISVPSRYSRRGHQGLLEILDYDALALPLGELVIDVSLWQGLIDWGRVKPHVQGAIMKASQAQYSDPRFWHNVTMCQKLRIPFGTYHFITNDEPERQAEYYHALVERTKPQELGMWADYEACTAETLARFIGRFEALGGKIGIYTNLSLWRGIEKTYGDRPLWLAQYGVNEPATTRASLWQMGDKFGMYGIHGPVDLNRVMNRPSQPKTIDLLPYIRPIDQSNGKPYMMQMADGRQERYQYQPDPVDPKAWYISKNGLWERWRLGTDGVVRLCMDTSPDAADDGTARYYKVTASDGTDGGLMFPRFMAVGERYQELNPHHVQFYDKATGSPHPQNSGMARNMSVFISQSADGMEVTIGDPAGETHTYRKGFGRVGWKSPWGSAKVSADDAGSYDNVREVVLP